MNNNNNNNTNNFTNVSHLEEALNDNNLNNNLNIYNKNADITTAEFLQNTPENVDSDNYLDYVIRR